MNPSAEKLAGWPLDEACGKTIEDIFRIIENRTREPLENPVWHVLETGQTVKMANDTVMIARNGKEKQIADSAAPILDNEETVVGTVLVFRDVAEEYKMRRELRDFKYFADHGNTGLAICNPDGQIRYVNRYWAEVHGYGVEELPGKHLNIFHNEKQLAEVERINQILFREGEYEGREVWHTRKDGSVFPMLMNGIVLEEDSGKARLIAASAIDITDRRQAERKILETNQRLQKTSSHARQMAVQAEMANRAKSDFLANMSHEIRTPMNGVIGMTDLLLDTELTDEQRRYCELVQTSGESLLALINDILDFSKIEAGKLDLDKQDFDLSGLLEDFAATMSLRAHDKGLELLCGTDPDVPTLLHGDPGPSGIRNREYGYTALYGARHRHRHSGRKDGSTIRPVQPAGRLDNPSIRGYGPGPCHLKAVGRNDGRRSWCPEC